MKRAFLLLTTLLLLLTAAAGCSGSKMKAISTNDFGKMLGSVPASVLNDHTVWFQDPGLAKQQAGFGQVNSEAALQALSPADQKAFSKAIEGALVSAGMPRMPQSSALFGWDVLSTSSTVFVGGPFPYQFTVSTGTFDVPLIKQKFSSENYTETSHDDVTYLTRGADDTLVLTNDFGKDAMASFDRLMVTNNTIITAPATSIMNDILDARAGKVASTGSEPAARALTDQLGDAYEAFITTPSGLTAYFHEQQPLPQFRLPAAANWTSLHDYALAGIGYRKDGQSSYLDICLAYTAAADAEADAPQLAARLKSYIFMTNQPTATMNPPVPSTTTEALFRMTNNFDISAPVVTKYDGAVTVTFHLRYLPTENINLNTIGGLGDLLFLVPAPSPYLAP